VAVWLPPNPLTAGEEGKEWGLDEGGCLVWDIDKEWHDMASQAILQVRPLPKVFRERSFVTSSVNS
jgi:hypothetical protein